MSILNVDQISPIGSGSTITVTATETKTGNITIGTGSSIFSPAGNTLVLGTNNLERIRIKNDGKVGIGTNNPTAKLEIKGSDNPLVKIVQDTSGIARLNLESATNDGYQYSGIGLGDGTNDAELMWTTGGFDINVGNAVRLRINSNGAWGAGTNFGSAGQVLTSQGNSSAPTWANAGGITHARGYRLNNTPDASGGAIDLTNWAYENTAFNGYLGGGWSLPSSGVFTFPTTGIYDVSMMGMMRQLNDSNAWCGVQGQVTTNNSNYNIAFEIYQQIVQASGSSNQYVNFYGHCILDVTNTSNVKFKVSFFADQNEQVYLHGGGSYNQTALKFTRLGDT